jgi:pimeloyl-ACP methyl ester carboxylesterase
MAPAVLMGHSMGGAIALTMALRAPQQVAGLVLVGSGARLRVAPAILELSAAASTFPHAVEKVMQAAFSSHTPDRLIQLARERMLAAGHTAFHNDFLACDHFDVRSRLAELTMPALVVSGRDDRLMPPKFGLELAEGLPVGEFAEIPHAGHMVMLEQAKALAKLVADFYQAHFHRN